MTDNPDFLTVAFLQLVGVCLVVVGYFGIVTTIVRHIIRSLPPPRPPTAS